VAIDGVPLRLYDATDLADYAVTYASFVTDSTNGTPIITETATGISIEPTKEVAYDAITGKIRWDRHGLEKDTMVQYDNSGGSVMGSLVDGRYYYLRDVTDSYFNLCYEKGGDPVALYYIGSWSGDLHSTKQRLLPIYCNSLRMFLRG
jgi:hypothetical protein